MFSFTKIIKWCFFLFLLCMRHQTHLFYKSIAKDQKNDYFSEMLYLGLLKNYTSTVNKK